MARVLRLGVGAGLNRTTRLQWDRWRVQLGWDTSGQLLEHLALETVVIVRVGRAARDIRSIPVMMVRRAKRPRVRVGAMVRRVILRGEALRYPGQWTQEGHTSVTSAHHAIHARQRPRRHEHRPDRRGKRNCGFMKLKNSRARM